MRTILIIIPERPMIESPGNWKNQLVPGSPFPIPALTNTVVNSRKLRTKVERNILFSRNMYFLAFNTKIIERARALAPMTVWSDGSGGIWNK